MISDKKVIRRLLKQQLGKIQPDQADFFSRQACQRIIATDEFARAKTIMIFLPISGEIDPRHIASVSWSEGKRICVPKVVSKGVMQAVEIKSLEDGIAPGAMGISEPVSDLYIDRNEIDFIVTPGLGFDRSGNRLGRGGGYYDRFLADELVSDAILCGIAFGTQIISDIPAGPLDRKIHMLATENELMRF